MGFQKTSEFFRIDSEDETMDHLEFEFREDGSVMVHAGIDGAGNTFKIPPNITKMILNSVRTGRNI